MLLHYHKGRLLKPTIFIKDNSDPGELVKIIWASHNYMAACTPVTFQNDQLALWEI